MKFIDFRFRPHTVATIEGIKNSAMFKGLCDVINFSERVAQPLENVVAYARGLGMERAVITGRDCEVTYGSPSNNSSVLEFVKAYPGMFIGFYGLDPHKGMAAVYSLTNAVEKEGMRGAAIDPYLAKIYPHDAKYYPVYSKCCELDIPVIITTGPATMVPGAVIDHVAPRYIDFVARDFPDLKIIMSHGGYPWVNEAIFVAQRNKNVYLDLSEYEEMPFAEGYLAAMQLLITDKILFASAHPFVELHTALEVYKRMPLDDETRHKIMYENARLLLGL